MIFAVLRSGRLARMWVIFALALFFCCNAGAKELRGDVIIMKNGDRFTGEVKSLQSGVLYIDTKYVSSNVGVDWSQVQEVQSKAVYLITLASGEHVTGKIERRPGAQETSDEFTIHAAD